MPIVACSCLCGGSNSLIQTFLKKSGYQGWLSLDIPKGKEKSRRLLTTVPQFPEVQALDNYIQKNSKWAIILGYNENGCRWVDLSHATPTTKVDGQHIIETFTS